MTFYPQYNDVSNLYGSAVRVNFWDIDPDPIELTINGYDNYDPIEYHGVLEKIIFDRKTGVNCDPTYIKFKQMNDNQLNETRVDKFRALDASNNYITVIPFERILSVEVKQDDVYEYIYIDDR